MKGLLVIVAVIAIGGAVMASLFLNKGGFGKGQQKTGTAEGITMVEVARHANGGSCWVVINNKVYDVTRFIPDHPGGKAILQGCGKEATALFEGKHKDEARRTLVDYYIADLQQ